MQKKAAIITAVILAAGVAFLYHMGCGISMFARVSTADSGSTHSKKDIRNAVSLVRSGFRDFEGCIMTELSYSAALSQEELRDYCGPGGKNVDDLIVFESTFTTSKAFSEPTFDGRTQRNWKWIVTHTEADGWKLAGSGYA